MRIAPVKIRANMDTLMMCWEHVLQHVQPTSMQTLELMTVLLSVMMIKLMIQLTTLETPTLDFAWMIANRSLRILLLVIVLRSVLRGHGDIRVTILVSLSAPAGSMGMRGQAKELATYHLHYQAMLQVYLVIQRVNNM